MFILSLKGERAASESFIEKISWKKISEKFFNVKKTELKQNSYLKDGSSIENIHEETFFFFFTPLKKFVFFCLISFQGKKMSPSSWKTISRIFGRDAFSSILIWSTRAWFDRLEHDLIDSSLIWSTRAWFDRLKIDLIDSSLIWSTRAWFDRLEFNLIDSFLNWSTKSRIDRLNLQLIDSKSIYVIDN
jgi:hypothetical protein